MPRPFSSTLLLCTPGPHPIPSSLSSRWSRRGRKNKFLIRRAGCRMSLRPELFREMAALGRLPGGEEDSRAWQKAYEAIEEALATLEEETLHGEEPALVFQPGSPVPASGGPRATSVRPHRAGGEVAELSVTSAAGRIPRRELSPVELVRAVLDRIDAYGKRINAYIALHAEEAIQAARQAEDALVHRHPLGPLHGVPLAVKDLFFEAGLPAPAGGGGAP